MNNTAEGGYVEDDNEAWDDSEDRQRIRYLERQHVIERVVWEYCTFPKTEANICERKWEEEKRTHNNVLVNRGNALWVCIDRVMKTTKCLLDT